jgi:Flp pilus assembly protein TadD
MGPETPEVSAIATPQIAARAQALIDLGRYDEALRLAAQGLAAAPSDSRLLCLSAVALHGLKRDAEAVCVAEQAITGSPGDQWAHRLRAIALIGVAREQRRGARRKTARRAIEAAQEAVRLAPNSHLGYLLLAEARLVATDIRGADAAVQEATRLAPESADAWITRSQVALRARNFAAAERAARTALNLAPDHFAAHNNLGAALLGRGKRQDAAFAFTTAGQLQPTSTVVQRNLRRTGMLGPRLLLVVALLPLFLVPNVGGSLYVFTLIGANVFVSRSPRLRRWAMGRGVRIGARGQSTALQGAGDLATSHTDLEPISPVHSVRTSIVVLGDVLAAGLTLLFVACAISPGEGDSSATFLPFIGIMILVDLLLARVTRNRMRSPRTSPARRERLGSKEVSPKVVVAVIAAVFVYYAVFLVIVLSDH